MIADTPRTTATRIIENELGADGGEWGGGEGDGGACGGAGGAAGGGGWFGICTSASDAGGAVRGHADAVPQVSVSANQRGATAGHSHRGTHTAVHTGAGSVHVLLHSDPQALYSMAPWHVWFSVPAAHSSARATLIHDAGQRVATAGCATA